MVWEDTQVMLGQAGGCITQSHKALQGMERPKALNLEYSELPWRLGFFLCSSGCREHFKTA